MNKKNPNIADDPTIMGNDQPRRDHDGRDPDDERDRADRAVEPKNPSSKDQATHRPEDRQGE